MVCTDAGLASLSNRKFNSVMGRRFITVQSLKKLKGFHQELVWNQRAGESGGGNLGGERKALGDRRKLPNHEIGIQVASGIPLAG